MNYRSQRVDSKYHLLSFSAVLLRFQQLEQSSRFQKHHFFWGGAPFIRFCRKGSRAFPGLQVNPRLDFVKVDSVEETNDKQQSPRSFLASPAFVTESANKAAASKYFSRSDFSIRDAQQVARAHDFYIYSHPFSGLPFLYYRRKFFFESLCRRFLKNTHI